MVKPSAFARYCRLRLEEMLVENQPRRLRDLLGDALIASAVNAGNQIVNELRAEGACEQEHMDRVDTTAMLIEAWAAEQHIIMLPNRCLNTNFEVRRNLILEGHRARLYRYIYDYGIKGGAAYHFMRISEASEACNDETFRRQKVEKQFAQLLERARANGWDA